MGRRERAREMGEIGWKQKKTALKNREEKIVAGKKASHGWLTQRGGCDDLGGTFTCLGMQHHWLVTCGSTTYADVQDLQDLVRR